MNEWTLYILECKDLTLYTGITKDLKRRISSHNQGNGASYTRSRRPVRLVYAEAGLSHSEALKKEYSVKKLTRDQKLKIILNKTTPHS